MNATAEQLKTTHKKVHIQEESEDMLVAISHEIENLSAEDAIKLVPSLIDGADENYFRLGGVLSVIQKNDHFKTEGFESFKDFLEGKYGLQYRKGMYWVAIYNGLIESGVAWNKVKDIGWTKLKDLAAVLTKDNVDEWVERANSSTTLQLQEAIKKAKAGKLETSGTVPESDLKSPITTLTIKVHTDQKKTIKEAIDKARTEAETEFDGVALEAICMNYLSGGNVNKPAALTDVLGKYSADDVLTAFEKVFPDVEVVAKLKKGAKH